MLTRFTFTLILAAVSTASLGCNCTGGLRSLGGNCDYVGDSCPSCGMAEASCGCSDVATCGLPEASCSAPEAASCGIADASCGIADASCGIADACSGDTCSTVVGCGSPVVGQCRLLRRIRNALFRYPGSNSNIYWSEWHNDPPSSGGCQSCGPQASSGSGGEYYSSASRRRSQLSKRGVNFGDELRFAEEGSGTKYR